jgi:hypothetical protein
MLMAELTLGAMSLDKLVEELGEGEAARELGLTVAALRCKLAKFRATRDEKFALEERARKAVERKRLAGKLDSALDRLLEGLQDAAQDLIDGKVSTSQDLLRRLGRKLDVIPVEAKPAEIFAWPRRVRELLSSVPAEPAVVHRTRTSGRQRQIIGILREHGPQCATGICTLSGATKSSVYSTLTDLKGLGKVTNETGRWDLTEKGRQDA